MNAQCTHCSTVFRVDPAKVPSGGVRVRCSICRGVFEVAGSGAAGQGSASTEAPQATSAAAPAAQPASAPSAAAVPAPVAATQASAVSAPAAPAPAPAQAATPVPAPAPSAPPASRPAPSSAAPAPAPAPAAPAPSAAPAAPRSGGFGFGSSDPGAKARRLARALISDIVMYYPERRDKALADGSLKREFMDEIKKSWEEYVGQVGTETARSTPHFRDSLNEILAKGQSIF